MMNKLIFMAGAAVAAMAISSCSEDTGTIGQSLTDDSDQFVLSTSTFQASTRTIVAGSVLSLSSNCYLGRVRDPETGADVTSEFTTQFHLMETMALPAREYLPERDEYGHMVADSCDMILYLVNPFKSDDSLTAMKMKVTELDQPVDEQQNLYSDYDPISQGLIRQDGLNKSHVFTFLNKTGDSIAQEASKELYNIRIPLNDPYVAKDGAKYRNYASYVMTQYFEHPEFFRNSYLFTHNVCPGLFFQMTDGVGFHSQINNMGLRLFYNVVKPDTAYHGSLVLAGTKEVKQTIKITNDQKAMAQLASETEHTYLKTPAGLFTEVTIPVEEIKKGHEKDSLLAAKITFQRMNNESTDKRLLGTPRNIMMLQKDSLKAFFENKKVPDSKTAFYTAYNSSYNTYTFSNISSLISALWRMYSEGMAKDPNWANSHPDWNKVVLVPITYKTTSTSTTPTNVEHDMSLTSTRLVGGANNGIDLNIVYAKFKE